ncbi:MAG: hypothetical protein ISR55_01005 [Bacteroidetes bacterium]|nr:hypothetical protein [Bacteroidota bacterium]
MKKLTYIIPVILIAALAYFVIVSSCTSKTEIIEKTNPNSPRVIDESIMVVAQGDFIIIPGEAWENVMTFYFLEYKGEIVEFSDVYLDTEDETPFISTIGFNSLGESRVLCIDLLYDQSLDEYHMYQCYEKNCCTGVNCSQCKYRKKTACNCIGDRIDPEKPSGCNHTTISGVDAVALGTLILGILKAAVGLM